ncbi:MAG: hypothetical protein CBD18_00225 [Opitutales bacterium TMED158]|nr:MAG: hypothetical protein CBD18_00225 [Opitutales bacterium TMED158]
MDTNDSQPEAEPTPSQPPQEAALRPLKPEAAPLEPISFEFTGQTGEYFNIWIVNLLLSVATLGLYWPWALVRSRRYFHAHTKLDGHAFDYLAKPKNLLIGY